MSRESFIIRSIRRLREYGEAIIMADQFISSLIEQAKGVYTILCLSPSTQKEKREIIAVLGLDQKQAEVISRLKSGEGIIRINGRYPYPVLLKFPFVRPQNLSNAQLDKINANDKILQSFLRGVKKKGPLAERNENHQHTSIVKKKALDVLFDIYQRFDIASHQRTRDLGLNNETSNRIYKLLEKDQLVEPISLNLTGKRGGQSKFYLITDKGAEKINRPPLKKYSGGTGAKHIFLQKYLKKHLSERGFKDIEIEKELSGKRIDLFCRYDEKKIAIEICVTTVKTEHINVEKDLDKCDQLILVCPDKRTKDKLENEIYQRIPKDPKIKIRVVYELLNNLDEMILK